jgi:hypothetical protein
MEMFAESSENKDEMTHFIKNTNLIIPSQTPLLSRYIYNKYNKHIYKVSYIIL